MLPNLKDSIQNYKSSLETNNNQDNKVDEDINETLERLKKDKVFSDRKWLHTRK